jgi:hypothetical protein
LNQTGGGLVLFGVTWLLCRLRDACSNKCGPSMYQRSSDTYNGAVPVSRPSFAPSFLSLLPPATLQLILANPSNPLFDMICIVILLYDTGVILLMGQLAGEPSPFTRSTTWPSSHLISLDSQQERRRQQQHQQSSSTPSVSPLIHNMNIDDNDNGMEMQSTTTEHRPSVWNACFP